MIYLKNSLLHLKNTACVSKFCYFEIPDYNKTSLQQMQSLKDKPAEKDKEADNKTKGNGSEWDGALKSLDELKATCKSDLEAATAQDKKTAEIENRKSKLQVPVIPAGARPSGSTNPEWAKYDTDKAAFDKTVQDIETKVNQDFEQAKSKAESDINLAFDQAKTAINAVFQQKKVEEKRLIDEITRNLGDEVDQDYLGDIRERAKFAAEVADDSYLGDHVKDYLGSTITTNGENKPINDRDVEDLAMGIAAILHNPEGEDAGKTFIHRLAQREKGKDGIKIQDIQLQTFESMKFPLGKKDDREEARKSSAGELFNKIASNPDIAASLRGMLLGKLAQVDLAGIDKKSPEQVEEFIKNKVKPVQELYDYLVEKQKTTDIGKPAFFPKNGEIYSNDKSHYLLGVFSDSSDEKSLQGAGLVLASLEEGMKMQNFELIATQWRMYKAKSKNPNDPKFKNIDDQISTLEKNPHRIRKQEAGLIKAMQAINPKLLSKDADATEPPTPTVAPTPAPDEPAVPNAVEAPNPAKGSSPGETVPVAGTAPSSRVEKKEVPPTVKFTSHPRVKGKAQRPKPDSYQQEKIADTKKINEIPQLIKDKANEWLTEANKDKSKGDALRYYEAWMNDNEDGKYLVRIYRPKTNDDAEIWYYGKASV